MQKTSTGKKVFISNSNSRPSKNLSKSYEKFYISKLKYILSNAKDTYQVLNHNKLEKDPNFKYFLYDKYSSLKQLNKLRNSQSARELLSKQVQKGKKLDSQIQQKQRKIQSNQYQDTQQIPFYKKYKPIPIQDDPNLSDYGIAFPRKYLQNIQSKKNFQKIKQNKQNLYKYRQTKGMVSPRKLKTQENSDQKNKLKKDFQPNYNDNLCPFQFKNTIQGALATRQSRNIRMDLNKTKKINNVNKIWYNDQQNHENLKAIRKSVEYQNKIRKCHSFDNYKGHKLFQSRLNKKLVPAQQKFYNPDGQNQNMKFYERWKTQNNIKMQKMSPRPRLPQKLGTNLEYNTTKASLSRDKSKNKRMGISSSERNLKFTRQVINPIRGCNR